LYLRARWYAPGVGRFTRRDVWAGDYRRPLTMNPYLYVLANPVNLVDSTGFCPNRNGIEKGLYSYSCNCGWIDWGHASPLTAKRILQRVYVGIEDIPFVSSNYKVIYASVPQLVGGVSRYAVVRRHTSLQENKEVALGIFMELTEQFEAYQGSAFFGLEERIFHSSFAEEDLPSNLIGFYVALDLVSPNGKQDIRISLEQLKAMVRPICDAPDNDKDDIYWSLDIWDEDYRCEKNRTWRPRLVSSCVIDSRCLPDRGWPAQYSSIRPQPPAIGGKWWWYRGQVLDGGLVPSGEEGVYHLWQGTASAPPGERFPTPTPPEVPHTAY